MACRRRPGFDGKSSTGMVPVSGSPIHESPDFSLGAGRRIAVVVHAYDESESRKAISWRFSADARPSGCSSESSNGLLFPPPS